MVISAVGRFLVYFLLFLLLFSIPLLNGCALLVAGGAGAEAGYIAGKKDQSAGEVVDDQVITSKIKTKIALNSALSALSINVDTEKGVVTLSGTVKSKKEAKKALQIARETKGVTKVVDKLKVE